MDQHENRRRRGTAELNQNGVSSTSTDTNTTEGDDDSLVARTVKEIAHNPTPGMGKEKFQGF